MNITEKLVAYLIQEYSPRAILLGGSHAIGAETEESDWDLFLYCESTQGQVGGFYEWDDTLLDLTFKIMPGEQDVLTTPFKPLWPVKILYDATDGVMEQVLQNTRAVYEQGPLRAYGDGCKKRIKKLHRLQHKLKVYQENSEVSFYYAGHAYELLIRIWFEKQNRWTETPIRAATIMQQEDEAYWGILQEYVAASAIDRIKLIQQCLEDLE